MWTALNQDRNCARTIPYFGPTLLFALAFLITVLRPSEATANSAFQPSPAIPVSALRLQQEELQLWSSFSARLAATEAVAIVPQVDGEITEIRFSDGAYVERGDILFVIDPAPRKAILDATDAQVMAAESQLDLARLELARVQDLVEKDTASKRLYEDRQNGVRVAEAQVLAAKAQRRQARIEFERSFIRAPISGRTSRRELTRGNIVVAGPQAPMLTSIVSTGHVYADFDMDERTYAMFTSQLNGRQPADLEIEVELATDSSLELFHGSLDSFDNQIATQSGTIRARAIFSSDGVTLLPGMFGKIRVKNPLPVNVLRVPERAIATNQDRKFVYVIDPENNGLVYREVEIGASIDGVRIVTKGLNSGEIIVVEGLMNVRPGLVVSPQLIDMSELQSQKSPAEEF